MEQPMVEDALLRPARNEDKLVDLAAAIVSYYVEHNTLPAADVPGLIRTVYATLVAVDAGPSPVQAAPPPQPAVPVRRSVTPDFIISLEDGKPYKSLKRHLQGRGLTPESYRAKWGLPDDYPMVAVNYSARRSALAKASGLGRKPAS
jgi:predicted transcriptional regulator